MSLNCDMHRFHLKYKYSAKFWIWANLVFILGEGFAKGGRD